MRVMGICTPGPPNSEGMSCARGESGYRGLCGSGDSATQTPSSLAAGAPVAMVTPAPCRRVLLLGDGTTLSLIGSSREEDRFLELMAVMAGSLSR
jgi:hypothetical protein